MARIVLKFGGTSVGNIDRIKTAARKIKAKVARLDDFQLQTALDYLQAAKIFRQDQTP